jgi:hypothetical protein
MQKIAKFWYGVPHVVWELKKKFKAKEKKNSNFATLGKQVDVECWTQYTRRYIVDVECQLLTL